MKGQIETKTTLDQNLTYTSLKTFIQKNRCFFSNPLFQLTPYLEIDIYKKTHSRYHKR